MPSVHNFVLLLLGFSTSWPVIKCYTEVKEAEVNHVVSVVSSPFIGNISTVACMKDKSGKLLAILLPFSLMGFFSASFFCCTAVGIKFSRKRLTSGNVLLALVDGLSSESRSSFSFSIAAN